MIQTITAHSNTITVGYAGSEIDLIAGKLYRTRGSNTLLHNINAGFSKGNFISEIDHNALITVIEVVINHTETIDDQKEAYFAAKIICKHGIGWIPLGADPSDLLIGPQ